MRTTKYIYAGEFESEIDFSELSRTVKAMTSEFNGKMQVLIVASTLMETEPKFAFHYNDNPFLACVHDGFTAIFQLDSLNIRQMIFMIDNSIVPYCVDMFNVNIEEFLLNWM